MERAFDLVIRGGTVVDGSGGAPYVADVAVKDGRIAGVGKIAGRGAEEIDAAGRIVTPGFVDIHTHYDGQATWDHHMQPSAWHGVTTVVMGNCGVGFAPCRPEDHDRLIRLMEGVEDIPFPVLTEGLPWNWESFPDYLDSLERRSFDVDIGTQLPHAALRVFVMGERGANREDATEADINAMAAIAKRAVEAGALGFSTSRTLNHRTSDGQPTPTLTASEAELTGIALGLAAAGKGSLQVVSDFGDPAGEFAMLRRIVERSGRPLSFSLVQSPRDPDQWRFLLDELAQANAAGLTMRAQVAGRPVGVLFGFELTLNPFSQHPAYQEIAGLPFAERIARMRDPGFRARLLSDSAQGGPGFAANMTRNWQIMFLMGAEPDYEQTPDRTVAALAANRGLYEGYYLGTRRAYRGLEAFVGLLRGGMAVDVTSEGVLVTRRNGESRTWVPEGEAQAGRFISTKGDERLVFDVREGSAKRVFPASGAQTYERAGFWTRPNVLATLAAFTALAAAATIAGVFLRNRREFRETNVQRQASLIQTSQGALWLAAIALFAVWASGTGDVARVVYGWPGPWLVIASACVLLASALTVASLLLLPAIWRGGRRVDSWTPLRKAAFSFTTLLYAAFAVTLGFWGALSPWSG